MSETGTVSKRPFVGSPLCASRAFCHECRSNASFRGSLTKNFELPAGDPFPCPEGITAEQATAAHLARRIAESPLPSLAERAGNLAAAGGRVLSAVAKGDPVTVSQQVHQQRLAVCANCPSQLYRSSDKTCAECGCPVRRKAALATEDCKLGYWRVQPAPELVKAAAPPRPSPAKVLTPNVWLDLKDALLAILPRDVPSAFALRHYDEEAAKPTGGCQGCHRRRLQAAALRAGMDDIVKLSADVVAQLQVLLADYTLYLDGKATRPLPESLRLRGITR